MPNFPKPALPLGLSMGLALSLLVTLAPPSHADMMHFMNGKLVHGKVDRVTGDLIEFQEKNNGSSKMNIHRIQLTNRHDVVEVRHKKRYFGEIVYVDKFKLDLKTATGLVKLNRYKVTNVVIGSPAEQPVSNRDVMPLAPQGSSRETTMTTTPNAPLPQGEYNPALTGWEDQDAIPAVNH